MANPFEARGEWYKGNLHSHTTRSDGRVTPEERVRGYEQHGYDFLALSDHGRVTSVFGLDTSLTLISAGEYTARNPWGGATFHLLALGIPTSFYALPDMAIQEAIDAVRSAGGISVVAHPYWCGLTIKDLERLDDVPGIEIFNTTCGNGIGKDLSTVHWDDLLASGWRGWGLAVDDCHFPDLDVYAGWIVAKARSKTAEDLLAAIADGTFYSTTGPTIHSVKRTGNTLHVECSDVNWINFNADRAQGRRVRNLDGSPVTSASYQLTGNEKYVRIECVSRQHGTAWTNPFYAAG
jgi:hypothetical protein